jgi:hypothetical protein
MRYLVIALIFLNSSSVIAMPVVQASFGAPATSPRLDMNAPYKIMECATASSGVSSGFVSGRVISSTAIQMPHLGCSSPGGGSFPGGDGNAGGGSVGGSPDVSFNSGPPCARRDAIRDSIWGRHCANRPWAVMNMQLANPADAGKMPLGKVVTVRGDFFVITQNRVQYWFVKNARVLYADPFGR